MQLSIFPKTIVRTETVSFGTADCSTMGVADNGEEFVLKRLCNGSMVPASEWICSSLAVAAGLAVPTFEIVTLDDGEMAFGSHWDNLLKSSDIRETWIRKLPLPENFSAHLSRIYAFDQFVYNQDRHLNNYFFRYGSKPGNPPVLLAPDYSRALFAAEFPPPDRLPRCNTVNVARFVLGNYGWEPNQANTVLNRLEIIPFEKVKLIVDEMPDSWLSQSHKEKFIQWWQNEAAHRARRLKEKIVHETF